MKKKESLVLGSLITLGIVYGDIGTSPLYVMNALIGDAGDRNNLSPEYIIGSLSLIFWTLMIVTTIKYVLIALRASNKGEGGIFALYALVKKQTKWLIIPAIVGGAAILADGTLTPAVTVTSAVEGLKGIKIGKDILIGNQDQVIFVTIVILLFLFLIQRFGTNFIGKAFGPIMVIWFSFLAVFGILNMTSEWVVLRALSPFYGFTFLFSKANPVGIFILGSIFLATTGAEALYSDMGHVGRKNIYITWPFVFIALILNYFGQGAWLIQHSRLGNLPAKSINPFFDMLPANLRVGVVILATFAAIIASQALITGSFTLVEEAIGLKILPRLRVIHPSLSRGQIYIFPVNWMLAGCTTIIVLYFRSSEHMEAAYGLAITVTMLMTTILLYQFIKSRMSHIFAILITCIFLTIETIFFIASIVKFMHGGFVSVIITLIILLIMIVWFYGNRVQNNLMDESETVSLLDYRAQLIELSNDDSIPFFMSNLVMLAKVAKNYSIKREILYSILDKQPKRAKVYWFVTVNTTNEPYTSYYTVDMMGTRNIVNLQLFLGFKANHSVNLYLRQVVQELMDDDIIDEQPQKYTTLNKRIVGDFCFVLIQELLSPNSQIGAWRRFLITGRIFLQNHSTTPLQWFGLEFSDVRIEKVPLFLKRRRIPVLRQDVVFNPKKNK
ncbi:MAG: KUP/HAK/KT family potassium transporter [Liquorilactobacillus sp.]|uniref:KUP/HAK/KT family potassium transporter n=1 Tax=Liquorilactobacillus sp. TaxID=2767923 RepID=UPI0039EC6B39